MDSLEENFLGQLQPDSSSWDLANSRLVRQISIDCTKQMSLFSFSTQADTDLPQEINTEPTRASTEREERIIDNIYEKNICGYITKKVVQLFLDKKYKQRVARICLKAGTSYKNVYDFYHKQQKEVFGITLLTKLIKAESPEEQEIKSVFSQFFTWFLRERYVIYLLKFGKMSEKEKYIEFKNKYLLYITQTANLSL